MPPACKLAEVHGGSPKHGGLRACVGITEHVEHILNLNFRPLICTVISPYVCMYVRMHSLNKYIYLYIYIYIHTYICTAYTYIHMYMCISLYVSTYIRTCMYIFARTHSKAYVHDRT